MELRAARDPLPPIAMVAGAWGLLGVLALLSQAIVRLTPLALAPLGALTAWQWGLYAASLVVNGVSEGYRGFQRSFSPRVARRLGELVRDPRPLRVALAPFFCMTLFHASHRQLLGRWGFVAGLATLIVLVHRVPQPYRGIIDGGVVLGLAWGLVATAVLGVRALRAELS